MKAVSVTSPENQTVTFVELFFDLVFVFSVTQIVGLMHHGLDGLVVGQAILVFWLVWWAWTQFTWALNAGNTNHPYIQLGTLLATAVAFFMAVALPDAFAEQAIGFAVAYVVVRGIGLALYSWVAAADPSQKAAVQRFLVVSLVGLATVLLGGFLGGTAQLFLWGIAIIFDIVAAAVGGQAEGWNLHPEHFGERHGLFVIIALGETLIVAASKATGATWTTELYAVAILAVAITCALWWSYFPRAKPVLDEALESVHGSAQTKLARDVYSLLHFPMLCGVIAYAYVVEETVAHPGETLALDGRLALAIGLFLFVGGMAIAIRRATRTMLWLRFGLITVTAIIIIAVASIPSHFSLAIAFIALLLIAILEQRPDNLVNN